MTKPITPKEVQKAKFDAMPEEVFEVFNKLIVENWNGNQAIIRRDEVVLNLIKIPTCRKIFAQQVYSRYYLNIEDAYNKAGWKVEYDKPDHTETYEPFFTFTKGKIMQPGEFITSDTHFGHANIIKYSNRPFSSVQEMDEELIARWNAKVPKNAVVYHLGDFAFAPSGRIHEILRQLNGRIRLLWGNHDKSIKKDKVLQNYFEWIKDYYESSTPDGTKVVMCHYAFMVWNKSHYGAWNLHGHSHGSLKDEGIRRLDIGVDTHPNYEPYSFEELQMEMAKRSFKGVDHHRSKRL
jgi:calcineurin-like phosphoesterase family protein